MTQYFSVRARALGAFLVTVVGIAVNLIVGLALDNTRVRRSLRARGIWIAIAVTYLAAWI